MPGREREQEGDGSAVQGQQGAPDVFGPSTGSDNPALPTM